MVDNNGPLEFGGRKVTVSGGKDDFPLLVSKGYDELGKVSLILFINLPVHYPNDANPCITCSTKELSR
jgi:hypothetical protein